MTIRLDLIAAEQIGPGRCSQRQATPSFSPCPNATSPSWRWLALVQTWYPLQPDGPPLGAADLPGGDRPGPWVAPLWRGAGLGGRWELCCRIAATAVGRSQGGRRCYIEQHAVRAPLSAGGCYDTARLEVPCGTFSV